MKGGLTGSIINDTGYVKMEKFKTEKSKALFFETKKYLVDGVSSSFHKAHNEEYPICMTHGKGAHMYDVDGTDYIDYVAGCGPMILGYAPESVNAAVREQLEKVPSSPPRQKIYVNWPRN